MFFKPKNQFDRNRVNFFGLTVRYNTNLNQTLGFGSDFYRSTFQNIQCSDSNFNKRTCYHPNILGLAFLIVRTSSNHSKASLNQDKGSIVSIQIQNHQILSHVLALTNRILN